MTQALTPELVLAARTLHQSRQIPKQRIAVLLHLSPMAVEWILQGGVLPMVQPDWSRATDELARHFEKMTGRWEMSE